MNYTKGESVLGPGGLDLCWVNVRKHYGGTTVAVPDY